MGCDVHCVNEIKFDDGWFCADPLRYERYAYDDKREIRVNTLAPDGRNYNYFAYLAGVRNYGDIPMLDKNIRGIPEDASKEYKEMVERFDCDGHTHSYYTFRELITGDVIKGKAMLSGYVAPKTAKYLEEHGTMPKDFVYCQGTSDKTWPYVEWYVDISEFYPLEDLKKAYDDILEHFFYVEKPTEGLINNSPEWVERQLKQYNDKFEEYLDKTRMCFFFDN